MRADKRLQKFVTVLGESVEARVDAGDVKSAGHNIATRADVNAVFMSEFVGLETPLQVFNTVLFGILCSTGFRLAALTMLKHSQITVLRSSNGLRFIRITPAVVSSVGAAKAGVRGERAAKVRREPVDVYEGSVFGGSACVVSAYQILWSASDAMQHKLGPGAVGRVFLKPKASGQFDSLSISEWFAAQPVGERMIARRITDICRSLGLRGAGERDHLTCHSFRGGMITALLESGVYLYQKSKSGAGMHALTVY